MSIELPPSLQFAIVGARYADDKDALIEALERACSWYGSRRTQRSVALDVVFESVVVPEYALVRHAAAMVSTALTEERTRRERKSRLRRMWRRSRAKRFLDALLDDHAKLKGRVERLEKANAGLRARVKKLEESK